MQLQPERIRCCRKSLVFGKREAMVRLSGHLEDGAGLVGGSAGRHDGEDGQLLCWRFG